MNNLEHSKSNLGDQTIEGEKKDSTATTTPKASNATAATTAPVGPSHSSMISEFENPSGASANPLIKETARFNGIEKDLKSALNTWSELSEKLTGKASPDEEQLKEIKKLLGDLKNKLQDFT